MRGRWPGVCLSSRHLGSCPSNGMALAATDGYKSSPTVASLLVLLVVPEAADQWQPLHNQQPGKGKKERKKWEEPNQFTWVAFLIVFYSLPLVTDQQPPLTRPLLALGFRIGGIGWVSPSLCNINLDNIILIYFSLIIFASINYMNYKSIIVLNINNSRILHYLSLLLTYH